jgi:hypothetical protein
LVIDGVEPTYRFASPLPAAAAVVQPAAAQPGAAVAAAAAAQPAPPAQPAAARAPRLVPAVAVAAPSAEELLERRRSQGGNGDSTRKRKANIAATATAIIITSIRHPGKPGGSSRAGRACVRQPSRPQGFGGPTSSDGLDGVVQSRSRTNTGGSPPKHSAWLNDVGKEGGGSRRAAGTERKLARSLLNALLNER